MALHHQRAPWVRDSEVEDSKLSLQIKDVGFSTKISSRARAFVGPMTDLRALHGQQVKWTYGSIDLLWPGQRGDTKGQPMHPNLRLRWFENVSMVFNIATRMAFLLLLFAALNIHAFIFNPVWLIPPAVAVGLNLRMTRAMHDKSKSDFGYALGVLPAEAYMWVRMGHFMTSWAQFFSRVEKDNWAAQASAENGRGKAYVFPAVVAATVFGILIFAWGQQSVVVQSAILSLGWPILYLITIVQTLFMVKKFVRRQRGSRSDLFRGSPGIDLGAGAAVTASSAVGSAAQAASGAHGRGSPARRVGPRSRSRSCARRPATASRRWAAWVHADEPPPATVESAARRSGRRPMPSGREPARSACGDRPTTAASCVAARRDCRGRAGGCLLR
jgi:hypothetical protein